MTPALDLQTAAVVLIIFSVIWVALGYFWGRGNTGLDDHMLAGRKVGLSLAACTAMATWVTTNTTMVAPQLALQMGIWGMLGYSLGSVGLLLFAPMSTRIRQLMPTGYTSGDFFRLRFGVTGWRIFLLISLAYSLFFLVSLGMGGGILIESLSGIPYRIGMSVILLICVLYTMLGGLKAVIGTDFIQTVVILTGMVAVGAMVVMSPGLDTIHTEVMERRPQLMNLLLPASIMFLFNNLLFGMGEIFHSNIWWSRAFAFGKGVGFKAYLLAGLFWAPVPIAAGFIALASVAMDINIPQPDQVGPMVAAALLGKTGAVLIFIVIFSALASSLDSLLAATSDLLLEDVYKRHIRPRATKQEMRKAASYVTLILGLVTWVICLPRVTNLVQMLHASGALVASTIWPIVAGLYWRKTNRIGAALAMFLGSTVGLISYFMVGFYVAALTGALVSFVITVGSTLIWPQQFSWDQLAENSEE
ncbi:MAG: urea transporter [Spirochaetaceae bacterium]|nr:urea transporter [Spirochaetaceae bacterium]|tara:strand:- start:9347 stop:10768 length:1422 start_codon:yes stop_codon:yes gene_type:complete